MANKKVWSTYKNSKSVALVNSIIATEDLEVAISYKTNALGDSVIVVKGCTEDVGVLEQVYAMVS